MDSLLPEVLLNRIESNVNRLYYEINTIKSLVTRYELTEGPWEEAAIIDDILVSTKRIENIMEVIKRDSDYVNEDLSPILKELEDEGWVVK